MKPIDLTGRVALITGANRGIGAAIVHRLAETHAHVIVTARSLSAAQYVADAIAAKGGSAEASAVDVTNYAASFRRPAAPRPPRYRHRQCRFDRSHRPAG